MLLRRFMSTSRLVVSHSTYDPIARVSVPMVLLSGGSANSAVQLSQGVWARDPIRADLIQRVVVWQLAKRRQGTAKGKNRAEVSGTGRKGARQKGLGSARVGSRRAPQFRHGGRAFPKRPRSFDFPLPRAVRKLGLINALSAKYLQGNLFVVPELKLEACKTKLLVESLEAHKWDSVLMVGGQTLDENLQKAAFNVPSVDVLPVQGLNVYDVMRRKQLVIAAEALEYIETKLLGHHD